MLPHSTMGDALQVTQGDEWVGVKQPEGLGHGAPMVLSKITVGAGAA
jgi:hypothetical protein